MNVNDEINKALGKEGYAGSVDDKLTDWLLSAGATGGKIEDLWASYLDLQAIPAGQMNDRWNTWLLSQGYTESDLDGKWLNYWTTRGAV